MRNHIRQLKKSFYAIILVFLAGSNLFAQQQQKYVLNRITYQQYDHEGKLGQGHTRTSSYDPDSRTLEMVYQETGSEVDNFWEKHRSILDDQGRTLEQLVYRWDLEQNEWSEWLKSKNKYLEDGSLQSTEEYYKQDGLWIGSMKYEETLSGDSSLQMQYQYSNGQWIPQSKVTVKHNALGMETERLQCIWDDDQKQWSFADKSVQLYSNDSLLYEFIRYEWTGQWEVREQFVRKFNEAGENIEEVISMWKEGILQPDNKTTSTGFILENRTTTDTVFVWNPELHDWQADRIYQQAQDEAGRPVWELSQSWDAEAGKWKDFLQIDYFYDRQGRIKQQQHFSFDSDGVVQGAQYVFAYDELGNRYRILYMDLDTETDDWIEDQKTELVFDSSIELDSLIDRMRSAVYNDPENRHGMKEARTYRVKDGKYYLESLTTYDYSLDINNQ